MIFDCWLCNLSLAPCFLLPRALLEERRAWGIGINVALESGLMTRCRMFKLTGVVGILMERSNGFGEVQLKVLDSEVL